MKLKWSRNSNGNYTSVVQNKVLTVFHKEFQDWKHVYEDSFSEDSFESSQEAIEDAERQWLR
jgi:hypothetical protein